MYDTNDEEVMDLSSKCEARNCKHKGKSSGYFKSYGQRDGILLCDDHKRQVDNMF